VLALRVAVCNDPITSQLVVLALLLDAVGGAHHVYAPGLKGLPPC
jgi:hypothetical protein